MLRKVLITILTVLTATIPVVALEFDTSIDEEIKQKYNSSKLEYEVLPNLPKTSPPTSSSTSVPKTPPTYTEVKPVITTVDKKNAKQIPSGTIFAVRSNQIISDYSKDGSTVSFTTTSPVYKKNVTIPTGTKIYGTITDVHRPQPAGNGGLVVLGINSITYNNQTFTINAKITKANSKKIFFNNIKGKHQYWKGVAKQVDKGENFFKKTRQTSNKMSNNPVLLILSPIPTIVGYVGYAGCTILSPLTGLTNKGGNLSIPAGSQFEIKLLEEAYIY